MHKYKGPQTATPTTISTDLGFLAALALALPTRTRTIYCILYKTCFYKGFSVFSIKCKEMNGLPFITPLLNSRFICLFFALVLHTTMRKIFCIKCWQLYGCQTPFTGKNLGVVSSWMDRYPTNIGNDFLIFFSVFTHHHRKDFLYFVNCKQMYYLLPHHYWQGLFAVYLLCHLQ